MTVTRPEPVAHVDLSLTRLYLTRAGYLLMGVGLVVVKCRSCQTPRHCPSSRA
ncbi:MAG TPA: hypothetical protein VIU11_10100 [Nakamurella sp.]